MKIGFGKHRGRDLREIESGYLRWAIQNIRNLDPILAMAIEAELASRVALKELTANHQEKEIG